MLSGEGGTASSPRFKSKQWSEGPDIFRGVKERSGRTSQDRRSARREFLQAEIQVCFERLAYLYKNQHLTGFHRSKRRLRNRRGQLKNRRGASFLKSWACSETTTNLHFQICLHLSHATSALDGISEIKEASSDIEEASAFPDMSASITCRVSFAEITGSLSKRRFQISKRHLLFQTC
ncbi:hypothetical protein ACFX15_029662 [Malus domestica]